MPTIKFSMPKLTRTLQQVLQQRFEELRAATSYRVVLQIFKRFEYEDTLFSSEVGLTKREILNLLNIEVEQLLPWNEITPQLVEELAKEGFIRLPKDLEPHPIWHEMYLEVAAD